MRIRVNDQQPSSTVQEDGLNLLESEFLQTYQDGAAVDALSIMKVAL